MAYTRETLEALAKTRRAIEHLLQGQADDLIAAWLHALQEAKKELDKALSMGDLDRAARLEVSRRAIAEQILEAARATNQILTPGARLMVENAASSQEELIASQLPHGIDIGFRRPDPETLKAIIERTTQQITVRTYYLSQEAVTAMTRALRLGISSGLNPREAARRMVADTEGIFNGNITRVYANLSKRFSPGNQLYFSLDENHTAGIIPGNRDVRHALMAAYDVTQDKFGMNVSLRYINGSLSLPQTAQGKNDAIWNLMRTQKPWGYVSERTWRAQSWTYDNDRVIGQARLSYLLPGAVKVETLLGMDVNFIRGEYLLPYGYLLNTNDKGARNVSNRRNSTLNWDIKANRRFDLGGGWQTTLTLLSQIVRRYETVNTVSTSVFSGNVTQLSAASEKQVSESDFEQRTWGLYGEAFFNYRNTLFINAGLRRDASNLIGANVASIYYPSLSVSYNQQAFKWRAAYGESGRLPYPTDAHTAYALTGSSAYGPLVAPSTQGNPNIRPERMREIELGTDVNLKRHRIGLSLYGQFTSDAIIYVPLRSSLGWLGSRPENIGSVRGYGFELNWNGTVWENRRAGNALDLFVSVNGQTNEVTNTGGRTIENLPNVIKEGQPAYAFYYKKVEGARYDAKGVYKGAQESKEYEYLGKPFPTVNGAVGFELKLFHNLTLNARVNYAAGASVYNQSYYNVAGLGDNLKKREDLKAALAKETPGTDAYRATAEQLAHTERNRDNYIEKADFIRLSSLSAGYDFSSPVRRATHQLIKTCRLMLSAQNLILITNYSGAEPQIEANGGTRQTRGIGSLSRDITNAPAPRSFIASLTIGF